MERRRDEGKKEGGRGKRERMNKEEKERGD